MRATAIFAVDPAGTGGMVLRGRPGPARDRIMAELKSLLPEGAPLRRVPLHIGEDRLLGGIDLAATLQAGRPVAGRGLLAEADGGVVVLTMAERIGADRAARIAAVLDSGEVGLARHPAAIAAIAFDEGLDDEHAPTPLLDRLAFHVDLDTEDAAMSSPAECSVARARLPHVTASDEVLESLCVTAAALGIASLRAPILALRVARIAAALAGRGETNAEDAALAAQLVLAPRATSLPAPPPEPEPEAEPEPDPAQDDAPEPQDSGPIADMVLEAAIAALPPGLLERLRAAGGRAAPAAAGKSGIQRSNAARGRPAGIRAQPPRDGLRLNLIETLRAAAPWQRLRGAAGRIEIRRDDLRVTRLKQKSGTTTIFVVDASGSQALNRLAEAKGAVELLLADCYVRRDQVAVLAFRGRAAQLLLPPTRSLVRAKRSLAGLPGGGGTPIAAGLDAGCDLADAVRRRGGTPALVLLTDGRANVGRDGKGGRAAAEQDASSAARRLRAAGHAALLLDTSPRPHPASRRLAEEMGARYLALPFASPAALSQSVRASLA